MQKYRSFGYYLNIAKQTAHLLAGLLTAHTSFHNPLLSVLMFIVFLIYELDEDWHIKDRAYRDILQYAVGLYLYAIMYIYMHIHMGR